MSTMEQISIANPREIVDHNFRMAVDRLGLTAGEQTLLKTPFREMTVEVPIRMDDGSTKVFRGYRVQHNGARGPAKGGIRYHPSVDINEVRALAEAMTWKTPWRISRSAGRKVLSIAIHSECHRERWSA